MGTGNEQSPAEVESRVHLFISLCGVNDPHVNGMQTKGCGDEAESCKFCCDPDPPTCIASFRTHGNECGHWRKQLTAGGRLSPGWCAMCARWLQNAGTSVHRSCSMKVSDSGSKLVRDPPSGCCASVWACSWMLRSRSEGSALAPDSSVDWASRASRWVRSISGKAWAIQVATMTQAQRLVGFWEWGGRKSVMKKKNNG